MDMNSWAGGLGRTIDVVVADIESGSFKVDPEEIRGIIKQLESLDQEVSTGATHTQGLIPHTMPAQVGSANVQADTTWNTLATGAKEVGAPSLTQNLVDLRNVIRWLHATMSNSFASYLAGDDASAQALNKAAKQNFGAGSTASPSAPGTVS